MFKQNSERTSPMETNKIFHCWNQFVEIVSTGFSLLAFITENIRTDSPRFVIQWCDVLKEGIAMTKYSTYYEMMNGTTNYFWFQYREELVVWVFINNTPPSMYIIINLWSSCLNAWLKPSAQFKTNLWAIRWKKFGCIRATSHQNKVT